MDRNYLGFLFSRLCSSQLTLNDRLSSHPNQVWSTGSKIVDFRPLGPHFDGFAAYCKAKGYSRNWGSRTLAKCCLFNAFLIDQGITKCEELSESLIDSFLDVYFKNFRTAGGCYASRTNARGMLIEIQAFEPPKPKPIKKPYSWILGPYLRYLRDECELPETTIAISLIVRRYMEKAGVKLPSGGSTTLRHSWAIRALAHDRPIKSIGDCSAQSDQPLMKHVIVEIRPSNVPSSMG